MPRKKGGGRNRGQQGTCNASDITLNDFANSNAVSGKSRMRKATTTNSIVKVVQEKSAAEALTTVVAEEKDWFDLTLDECNFDSGNEEELEDRGGYNCVRSTRTRRKKANKIASTKVEEEEGNIYPIDIWFLIGAYLKPEDVLTFSLLCKSAYAVTKTSKFWTRLYKRYYKPLDNLPVRLQPGVCLERLFGLRACVIRSLYYFYPPFQEKIKNRSKPSTDSLLKLQISTLWHQTGRGLYHYYFKLEHNDNFHHNNPQPDLMELLTDIDANSEKRCKVLQLTSRTFTHLPPTILGQTLLSIQSVLSPDLRSDNVRLIVGPPHALHHSKHKLAFSNIPENAIAISINHVVMTKILEWYYPSYPHSHEARLPSTTTTAGSENASNPPEDIFF